MSSIWVVNASPVIVLAKVGQLRLLEVLGGGPILPDAVAAEIMCGPPDDPGRKALDAGWGQRRSPARVSAAVLEWGLGAGETSVVALAMETQSSVAVLDDAAARAAARSLGVPLMGTLSVLIHAKRHRLLPSAGSVIADLRAGGMYLNDSVIRAALQEVGETWA